MEKPQRESNFRPMDAPTQARRRRSGRAWSKSFFRRIDSEGYSRRQTIPCSEHAHDSPRWSGGSKTPYAGEPPPDHPWSLATALAGVPCAWPLQANISGVFRNLARTWQEPASDLIRVFETVWERLERSWRRSWTLWRRMEASWGRLGRSRRRSWASWRLLEASWAVLEASLRRS